MAFVAVLVALVLLPVAAVRVPVLGDTLNHLARISIMSRIGHTPDLQAFYLTSWKFVPYYGMDVPVLLMARFLPIYAAGRIFVGACILVPVISTFALHYAVNRRHSLAPALSFLFCYNHVLERGFLNYLFSSGLAVLLFAAWLAAGAMQRWLRLGLFSVGVTVLYLCHGFAFAEYCLLVGGYEIGLAWRRGFAPWQLVARDWIYAALPAVPALGIGVVVGNGVTAGDAVFNHYGTLLDKVGAVMTPFYFPAVTTLGAVATGGGIALLLASAIVLRGRYAFAPALIGPVVAVAVAGAVTPSVLMNIWGADFRLPLLLAVVVLGGLAPRAGATRRDREFVLACVLVLVALRSADAVVLLRRLDGEAADVRAVVAHMPRGKRLLVVDDDPPGGVGGAGAMAGHIAMVAAIDRDAFLPFLFTGTSALQPRPAMRDAGSGASEAIDMRRLREGLANADPAQGPPPFGWGGRKYWLGWRAKFDYVLVEHGGGWISDLPAGLVPVFSSRAADLYFIKK